MKLSNPELAKIYEDISRHPRFVSDDSLNKLAQHINYLDEEIVARDSKLKVARILVGKIILHEKNFGGTPTYILETAIEVSKQIGAGE